MMIWTDNFNYYICKYLRRYEAPYNSQSSKRRSSFDSVGLDCICILPKAYRSMSEEDIFSYHEQITIDLNPYLSLYLSYIYSYRHRQRCKDERLLGGAEVI